MKKAELEQILEETLADGRLSRGERRALAELFEDLDLSASARAGYLNRAFEVAGGALQRVPPREVLEWLLALSKIVARAGRSDAAGEIAEVLFEPGDDCMTRLRRLFEGARESVRVCVFTITDNRVVRSMLDAQRRGVVIRVISDDDKSFDLGSDIDRLRGAGIDVRCDRVSDHMHHKFAVFDGKIAMTGSYNWTRGAAEKNRENMLISDDRRLVSPFVDEFEALWTILGDAESS
ncbi:MAG: phospholipase D-like domain-containing protein [Acidobacteriota bacterium]